MHRLTLRSPLGTAFRAFAFSVLLCSMTCVRAVAIYWRSSPPGTPLIARQISLDGGRLCMTTYDSPHASPPRGSFPAEHSRRHLLVLPPDSLDRDGRVRLRSLFTNRRQTLQPGP